MFSTLSWYADLGAYFRNHIEITITLEGLQSVKRSGYTLAILRKQEGRWRARDANLVA